jgi:hypothetical protein
MNDRFDRDRDRIRIGDLGPGDVALLKNVAKEAAEETMRQFMTALGIDPKEPMMVQRDMQFLRRSRERSEGIPGKVLMTVIGLALMGAANTLWVGLKSLLAAGQMPTSH